MKRQVRNTWWGLPGDRFAHLGPLLWFNGFVCGRPHTGKRMFEVPDARCPDCEAGRKAQLPPGVERLPKPRRSILPTARIERIEKAGGRCASCGLVPHPSFVSNVLHVHHIVPRAKGGTDKKSNLVTICANCHALAHAIWPRSSRSPWHGPTTRKQFLRLLPIRARGEWPKDRHAAVLVEDP